MHQPADGPPRPLATTADRATTTIEQIRGLMFRRSIPDDYALVFEFQQVGRRSVHMLFVPFPLDVIWLRNGHVEQCRRLRPWIGLGMARADAIIELPAGAAAAVEPGDRISIDVSAGDRTG